MGYYIYLMEIDMKVNLKIVILMDMGYFITKMEIDMTENL